MTTQTVEKELVLRGPPSIRDVVWNAKLRKVLALNFLASGIGIALILSIGNF